MSLPSLPPAAFAASLCLVLANGAAGAIVTAIEDNFVNGAATTTVQDGSSGNLSLKRASSINTTRKVWMKFDLAGQDFGTGEATFTITLVGASSGSLNGSANLYALNGGFTAGTGELGIDWTEGAIHWNNAPGNNVAAVGTPDTADTTLLGNFSYNTSTQAAGTVFSVPFTSLGSYLQSDASVTLILVMQSQSDPSPLLNLASSENTTHAGPQLTFVPEPGTAVSLLGGLGVLLGGQRLRRRR